MADATYRRLTRYAVADIELNPFLDDATRQRWRLAIYLVPGALAI